MEMHKRRRAITEPEVRYIMKQIIDAVVHLHKSKVPRFLHDFTVAQCNHLKVAHLTEPYLTLNCHLQLQDEDSFGL